MTLLPGRVSEGFTTNEASRAHLKSTVEVRHLLGVLPLHDPDTLLHLLSLRLDIFPKRNESVDCGLKCFDKRLRIKCCMKNKTVSLR